MDHVGQFSACLARVRDFIDEQAARLPGGGAGFPARPGQASPKEGALPAGSGAPVATAAFSGAGQDRRFNELALEVFHLQYAYNPVLRHLCDARAASPASVADWREIPAIPAASFKEFDVTLLPPEERATVFYSSGTTGQRPGRHFHSADSLGLYEASLRPWFRAHLLADAAGAGPAGSEPRGLCLICLTPPPGLAPHSSLVHMLETVRRGCAWERSVFLGEVEPGSAWTLDLHRLAMLLDQTVRAQRPVAMLGTAFGFVHLLDHLAAAGTAFNLPAGSRVMETGGYKGRSRVLPRTELHALITRCLGIPPSRIVCEYGMSELSSQAYDRSITCLEAPRRQPEVLFRFPPWARVQVISPETGAEAAEGEPGLVRVFDLANVASSLAIQTEDLAVRHGDGVALLGRCTEAEPRGCSLLAA